MLGCETMGPLIARGRIFEWFHGQFLRIFLRFLSKHPIIGSLGLAGVKVEAKKCP